MPLPAHHCRPQRSSPIVDPAYSPALVPTAALPTRLLQDFGMAMRKQGHNPMLQRMCYDRSYAFDCMAQAHASTDEGLRKLALALFAQY